MKIILLGAPGAGKGTCSDKLVDKLKIPYLSTGDEFRRLKKKGSPLGVKAYEQYKNGVLVSDEIVNGMVKEILEDKRFREGYLLDGYPRTIPQAEAFEKFGDVDYVVNLDLPLDVAKERILSRLVCEDGECGKSYSSSFISLKPKKSGVCDDCYGPLKTREDDMPEKVEKRFREFLTKTFPLVYFYKKKGVLCEVDARLHSDKMVERVYEALTIGKKSGVLVK